MFRRIANLFRSAPSQEFLASFATPRRRRSDWAKPECCGHPTGHWSTCHSDEAYLADAGGDPLLAQVAQVVQEIRMGRVPLSVLIQMREALAQVPGQRVYVPTGAEFDAHEAQIIAADVQVDAPAKRVRVYHLAADLGVDSKFLRGVMDHQFGIATKSPSSTVSALQALTVTEFFHTHAEV